MHQCSKMSSSSWMDLLNLYLLPSSSMCSYNYIFLIIIFFFFDQLYKSPSSSSSSEPCCQVSVCWSGQTSSSCLPCWPRRRWCVWVWTTGITAWSRTPRSPKSQSSSANSPAPSPAHMMTSSCPQRARWERAGELYSSFFKKRGWQSALHEEMKERV